ncbi:BsuBI/PstI family type II restriction endonuclease [Sphingosinicella microcystinivorans]|uniref:BsuBI/PstI family type II restriction endonuclease n=1 Tax=Sphingosinicella microcystinivorans TaxID=335406 RepID=UPI0022F394CA|nr:BsuBI/PstI family type II restriction endonuclease [Sphingosinicella microcystinivorans]WBX86424.1 BsuBI/PstI family type II restriction endonuclease [Sphingosinicella microcystinivorans]
MAEAAKTASDTGHAALINDCVEHYAPRFLEGYEVLYVDDSDGDRISDEERAKMQAAGAELTLADPMPDVLLWHPETDWLWVIEAVTSDGEVDAHKVKGMQASVSTQSSTSLATC